MVSAAAVGRVRLSAGIEQPGGSGSNPPVSQPVTQPTAPTGNTGGLDPNVAALVAALGGINWGTGTTTGGTIPERELSLIRPTEFAGTESEDPNDWLERYNRIADANKWNAMRRFQIVGGYLTGAAAKWYDTVKHMVTA